jgi:translation initiation factor 3 subunit E
MADSNGVPEENDLLPKLIPNLDRHLVFPLLNFVADPDQEPSTEQKQLTLELLQATNMADYVGQLYADIHGLDEAPPEYAKRREDVLKKRDQFVEETSKISSLLDDDAVVSNLRSDKVANMNYLKESHGVTVEMVNQLYEFGQFQYSCGIYGEAAELLYRFRVLVG